MFQYFIHEGIIDLISHSGKGKMMEIKNIDKKEIAKHLLLLDKSFQSLTANVLFDQNYENLDQLFENVYRADYALISHGTEADPIINFANLTAQKLWQMSYEEICQTPSRFTAEKVEREERARLLAEVNKKGYIDSYTGIRISKSGRRFLIKNAIVWNVTDEDGALYGQAAYFKDWEYLEYGTPPSTNFIIY